VRLLLDEHFSPTVAEQLRSRGHDVVAVVEVPKLRSRPDEVILEHATAETRAVLSDNVRDFVLLHEQWRKRGELHAGIVLTSRRRFPRTRRGLGALVEGLHDLLQALPDDSSLCGTFTWL
jgi:predicted nuclease of predicted toxin-antitoxin system